MNRLITYKFWKATSRRISKTSFTPRKCFPSTSDITCYSSVVEQVKIDRSTGSSLITMDEIKKRLKEDYLQLKREHGWSEDEMALNMKSSSNQSKNIKKGNKGRFFKGRCNHCGKYGHKKADCWDLKSKQESGQENERKGQKDKSKVR